MFIYIYIARKNLESVLLLIYAFGICSKRSRKLGNIRINSDNTRNFNAEFFTKSTNVFFWYGKMQIEASDENTSLRRSVRFVR